jgi:hypothetical protein
MLLWLELNLKSMHTLQRYTINQQTFFWTDCCCICDESFPGAATFVWFADTAMDKK